MLVLGPDWTPIDPIGLLSCLFTNWKPSPLFRGRSRVSRCRATGIPPNPATSDWSDDMRLRTLVGTLALAAPLIAFETGSAAACDWGWGTGYGYASYGYGYGYPNYGYSGCGCAPGNYGYYGYAPRGYGYYGYAPSYYGGYGFYGRRWGWGGYGWRGYGSRGYGWRGYGWRGYGYRGWRGARVGPI